MGLTITRAGDWIGNPGDRISGRVTVAFDNSYPTGGELLTAADLGMGVLDFVIISPRLGYVFEYDYTNKKVLVFQSAGSAAAMGQVPDTTDLATLTGVQVYAIGKP